MGLGQVWFSITTTTVLVVRAMSASAAHRDASDPNSLEIFSAAAMALVARTLTRREESRGYAHGLLSDGARWRLERGRRLPRDALLIRWRRLRAERLGIRAR